MPLEFQHIPMNIQGLDTKTDDKNVISGKFVLAENCQMQKSGKIQSRYGYTAGSGGNAAHIIAGLAGEIPLAIRPGFIDQLTASLKSTATTLPTLSVNNGVDLSSGRIGGPNILASDGSIYTLVIAAESASTFRASILDMTDVSEKHTTTGTGTITSVKVCALANNLAFVAGVGANRVIGLSTGGANFRLISLPTGLIAITHEIIDIGYNSLGELGAVWKDATTNLYFSKFDGNFWSTPAVILAGVATTAVVGIARDTVGTGWNVVEGETNIYNRVFLNPLGAVTGAAIGSIAGYTYATAIVSFPNSSLFAVQGVTKIGAVPVSFGVSIGGDTYIPLVKIAAKPYGNLLTLINGDVLNNGLVTARVQQITGVSTYNVFAVTSASVIAYAFSYSSGRAQIVEGTDDFGALPISSPWLATGGYFFSKETTNYIKGISYDMTIQIPRAFKIASDLPTWVEFNGAAYTNAFGVIKQISSTLVGPSTQIICYPFPPAQPTLSAGTGVLAAGVYSVVLVYEGLDAQGRLIYSPPSNPISFTAGAATGIVVAIATMANELGAPTYTEITAYITKLNGTIYYRANSSTTAAGSFTISTEPTGSEQALYTTGGAVDAGNPGLSAGVFVARDRLWSISAEDRNVVFFSTISTPTDVPKFNEGLYLTVPDLGGKLTAVAEMDEKVILFKENAIYITYGQGPDNLGAGQYPAPQLISQSMGCKYPRSVVLTDAGVMFMSNEGIWIISRGLQLQYLGAPVEAYNALTITGAMNLVDRHQCWFFSSEGTTLAWDDFHSLWYAFTQQPTKAQILLTDGTPTFVNSSTGVFLKESKTAYKDNGVAFKMRVKTGWVTLTGIQGFQRFRRLQWSGAAFDSLIVTLYYDFSTTIFETFTITPDVSAAFQKEIKPARQKCEAIQIDIQSTNLEGPMSISAFSIEAGAKKGTNRLAPTKRIQGV